MLDMHAVLCCTVLYCADRFAKAVMTVPAALTVKLSGVVIPLLQNPTRPDPAGSRYGLDMACTCAASHRQHPVFQLLPLK